MVLAQNSPPPDLGLLIAAAAIAVLIVVPIVVVRSLRRSRARSAALTAPGAIPAGSVHFRFHRYSGFLVWTTQSTYDQVLPVERADALMKELVRHNLTWGLLCYGGVVVPVLTYFEWRSQKKRIAAARPGFPVAAGSE